MILVVYRPPPTKTNGLKLSLFWKEWHSLLSTLMAKSNEFMIVGDLNFHLDDLCRSTIKFNNILSEYGLLQHVNQPTHVKSHTLDILITLSPSNLVSSLLVLDPGFITDAGKDIKDHFMISWTSEVVRETVTPKAFQFRNWKGVETQDFQTNLRKRLSTV